MARQDRRNHFHYLDLPQLSQIYNTTPDDADEPAKYCYVSCGHSFHKSCGQVHDECGMCVFCCNCGSESDVYGYDT